MNERIIELAKQCGYWSGQTIEMNDVGIEKFAQLIARECINISTKIDKNSYIPDGDQAKKIVREIKEHFGVEE